MLKIDYDASARRVVFTTLPINVTAPWYFEVRRILEDFTSGVSDVPPGVLTAPWWSFLSTRKLIGRALREADVKPTYTDAAAALLKKANARSSSYIDAQEIKFLGPERLDEKLKLAGFNRTLTPKQYRNIGRLVMLPAAATFSVPGAGKTTEALAYFYAKAMPDDRLVVIAPKNAFGAWDEQIKGCVGTGASNFSRLVGGKENIRKILEGKPRFMLVTYDLLARTPDVSEMIADVLAESDTFLFLDESHRIKDPSNERTGAILRMAFLPAAKLVMSGTPMPQDTSDLLPQFNFLYPEVFADVNDVVGKMKPIYVRTTKAELELPKPHRLVVPLEMRPAQRELYDLMRVAVIRQASGLGSIGKEAFKRLGRSVMKVLQAASNPALLSAELYPIHSDLVERVLSEGDGVKIDYACERARGLAAENRKVLIWTSFRSNVDKLADRLDDIGAVYIHGGVDAGSVDDDATREGKIHKFHTDKSCMVLIANPAAASEGISLHKICQHAIYVDRTYNAAHYLQSEDRIHRYGLEPHQHPILEILECTNSIDQSVRQRLELKINRMATALDDPSLQADPMILDVDAEGGDISDPYYLDEEDIRSILKYI